MKIYNKVVIIKFFTGLGEKRKRASLLAFFLWCSTLAADPITWEDHFLTRFAHNTAELQMQVYTSPSTLGILAAATPYYLLTRHMDESLNECFFCFAHKKNINQWDPAFHDAMDKILMYSCLGFGLLAFWPFDRQIKVDGEIFLAGLLSVYLMKNILKQHDHEGCLRPKNEHFDPNRKWYGGCPSGHMAEAIFMTTYWGYLYGPIMAVPLALFSCLMGIDFVVGNRHYVSQLIAGAALGVTYGIAACKIHDHITSSSWYMDFTGCGVEAGWQF